MKFSDIETLQHLPGSGFHRSDGEFELFHRFAGRNYKAIAGPAGNPQAINCVKSNRLSRGWQTPENRKAQQTATDKYLDYAVDQAKKKLEKSY